MVILNFSHPLMPAQVEHMVAMAEQKVERVTEARA